MIQSVTLPSFCFVIFLFLLTSKDLMLKMSCLASMERAVSDWRRRSIKYLLTVLTGNSYILSGLNVQKLMWKTSS